ncbi:alpha/beta hydrolase family esterase [Amaricoccus solimangrovi]|uniref:Poly(3-hydroxybutyrate) depolymerase n=1 Tax=Amaricoccus solimangrovi TaxID=2589815 RepID=A0A501WHA6_9RHOB|nr:poly(3-hydroxybutyrate) depolymerase [Amaricoccus solimangrovi]TPE48182.1 poly(3-hydroxybutyrate) depolymerase [Amaricoccus solimangrovi]
MLKHVLAAFLLTAPPGVAEDAVHLSHGDYRIVLPDGPARGAYVFFHGYQGSAALTLRDQRPLVEVARAHGLAFVAVDGREGRWSMPHVPAPDRDDQAFIGEVLDDLALRHGFNPGDTVLGGFSLGASLAWYAACFQGQRFAGMVTFSGVFWSPPPAPGDCVAAVPPTVHFHGIADRTFPLAGRAIDAAHRQGDTFGSIAVLRSAAGCDVAGTRPVTLAGLVCETMAPCRRGPITLCLHPGGHGTDARQLDAGLSALGF